MAGKGYANPCEYMKGDDTRELPKSTKGMQVLGKKSGGSKTTKKDKKY